MSREDIVKSKTNFFFVLMSGISKLESENTKLEKKLDKKRNKIEELKKKNDEMEQKTKVPQVW